MPPPNAFEANEHGVLIIVSMAETQIIHIVNEAHNQLAIRESIGASLPPAVTAEWEAGRSLELDQTIELALSNP